MHGARSLIGSQDSTSFVAFVELRCSGECQIHLAQSVVKVFWQMATPKQICQLVFYRY
jgi:hypothetical protein